MQKIEEVFLEKNHILMLRIVRIVLEEPTKQLTYFDIAQQLRMDRRVVKKHIEELMDYEEIYQQNHFTFQQTKFTVAKPVLLEGIKKMLLRETVKYKMMEQLFYNQLTNCTEFCLEVGISRSVFQRHVSQLRAWLRLYEIDLSFHKKKRLSGAEHQIRYMYYEFFKYVELPVTQEVQRFVACLMKELLLEEVEDYFFFRDFQLHFYIFQQRVLQKQYLDGPQSFQVIDHPLLQFQNFCEIFNKTEQHLPFLDARNMKEEYRCLYLLFCSTLFVGPDSLCAVRSVESFLDAPLVGKIVRYWSQNVPFDLSEVEQVFLALQLYYIHQLVYYFVGVSSYEQKHISLIQWENWLPKDAHLSQALASETVKLVAHMFQVKQQQSFLSEVYQVLLRFLFLKHKKCLHLLLLLQGKLNQSTQIKQLFSLLPEFDVCFLHEYDQDVAKADALIFDWSFSGRLKQWTLPSLCLTDIYQKSYLGELTQFLCQLLDGQFVDKK